MPLSPFAYMTMNIRNLSLLFAASLALTCQAADYSQAVSDLIPKLASATVGERYDAQMQLQEIASQSSRPGHAAEREALGRVLADRAGDASVPQPARVWIVRQLEYMGGDEAVNTLTRLLNDQDAELREVSRRALEKNPSPVASKSLWVALEKVATDREPAAVAWKIGLINALGERRDTAAVGLIVPRLQEAATARAAALALGKIANPPALEALWTALPANPAAGDALIVAGNRLLASGDAQQALAIARRLQQEAASVPLKAAALALLVKTNPAEATPLIQQALTSAEPRLQQAALTAAAASMGNSLTPALAPLLPKLNPSAKSQVLAVLDASAEPQIIAAVSDADEGVRRSALESLGRVGTAASVPVLINATLEDGKPGKSTAEAALARIAHPAAAAAIEQAAGAGEPRVRVAAINTLAARRQTASIPSILRYAADSDANVRKASYNALKAMAGEAEIVPLANLVLAGKSEAGPALEAACQAAPDKSTAASQLTGLAGQDEARLGALLDAFSVLGSDNALVVVTRLVSSKNADLQNEAVRALGNWTDLKAAKPLMSIAANKEAPLNQYVLAMQGVARLVRSSDTQPGDDRVTLALSGMEAARRVEEKRLMLSALAAVPHRKAADAIKPLLADPQLKAEACVAGVSSGGSDGPIRSAHRPRARHRGEGSHHRPGAESAR